MAYLKIDATYTIPYSTPEDPAGTAFPFAGSEMLFFEPNGTKHKPVKRDGSQELVFKVPADISGGTFQLGVDRRSRGQAAARSTP